MSNAAIDKKNNNKQKKQSEPHDPKSGSYWFHNHECVTHDIALSTSIMQSFQSIQES
ncbi:hypothetical protein MtrunA17_Chr5g0428891 [Medicago truncatula]|uniref:Uncharacterized protein n=1 Tax=Medicago truncatula TaxID=3880 RepID=A0A396HV08_MEDTR|nr:hypothetical protein MtrunA17_Chr5g0428891 [Medicago truncatula]